MKSTYKTGLILTGLLFMILLSGCSAKKNTPSTRAYHELSTRYNIYHNAEKTYNEIIETQLNSLSENWYSLLPLYPGIQNINKTQTGGPFDIVIDKCVKAIQEHSITASPRRDPSKAQSTEYRQWLKQEEFNPFLKNVWLLMGKAHAQNGDYEIALSVFREIMRIYPYETDLLSEVQIWMMRCYTEMKRIYDAENMSVILSSRKLPENLSRQYTEAYTNYLLRKKQYSEALPYIVKLINSEKNYYRKKRLQFIVGQINTILGEDKLAYSAFEQIKGLRTPPELTSYAEIYQSILTSYTGKDEPADSLKQIIRQNLSTPKLTESQESKSSLTQKNLSEYLSQWRAFRVKDKSPEDLIIAEDIDFATEKNAPHKLLLQSANISDEFNELLFATANFNFSNFQLRTFNLSSVYLKQGRFLSVESFYNYDDALHYLQQINSDSIFRTAIPNNITPIIISEENLEIVRSIGDIEKYNNIKSLQIEKILTLKSGSDSEEDSLTIPSQMSKEPDLPVPERKERGIEPEDLKSRLERNAKEALKQSEQVSDKKSRDKILKEREKERQDRIKQREKEIEDRIRKREAELKQRELEREQRIKEQELHRKGAIPYY